MAPSRVSQRFLDHRWIAEAEAKRAKRRRFPLPFPELRAAAQVGLWEVDARAPADTDGEDFCRWARKRCRGAILDALREAVEGGRRGDRPNAYKPYQPAPGAVEVAQLLGQIPHTVIHQDVVDVVSPLADPEQQLLQAEAAARRARVLELIARLPPPKGEVLERRLAGERALDIARSLGVTQARVSQIQTEAVTLLRELAALRCNTSPAARRR